MKIFLSYISTHKQIAGKIKNELDNFGFECFLAHEDIEPTKEWESEILKNLKDSKILIAILTKGFENSSWCNQEVGYFIGSKKLIIPLKVDIDPPAFISSIQALTYKSSQIISFITKIISKSEKLKIELKKLIIKKFVNSNSWDEAGLNSENLLSFGPFNKIESSKIIKSTISNSQIHRSFNALPFLRELIDLFDPNVDETLLKKYRNKIN